MSKDIIQIQRALVSHWDKLLDHVRCVCSGVIFDPHDGFALFQPNYQQSTEDVAVFEVGPVVINLPEKANHYSANLYVVTKCRLSFSIPIFKTTAKLAAIGFATHVAYFRRGSTELQHVYGMHYDFDMERPAHPVFHAQMKSFANSLSQYVKEKFGVDMPMNDRMDGVLQNVRLPIAQLDFFSLVVQLAADHLIWKESAKSERDAFNEILALDSSISGATEISPSLTKGAKMNCHRALHWYPPT